LSSWWLRFGGGATAGPIGGHPGSNLLHRSAIAHATYTVRSRGRGLSLSWGRAYPWHHNRLRPGRNSDEEEAMKKLGFMTLLITATLLFTLAFSAAAAGPKAPAAPVPAVAAVPASPAPVALHCGMRSSRDRLSSGALRDTRGHCPAGMIPETARPGSRQLHRPLRSGADYQRGSVCRVAGGWGVWAGRRRSEALFRGRE